MAKDPVQRYAESLESTLKHNHHYLKETIEDFQELCRMVTPEKNVPPEIIVDIRELYKEIRNRLTEFKAIQQLLQGKYRMYYHRDSIRDKEIMEFGFIAKNGYSKLEFTLKEIEAKKRLKEKEKPSPAEVFRWFSTKENHATFLKTLRLLYGLDYDLPTDLEVKEEKRKVSQDTLRSLTFFVISGETRSIDHLQSQIRFREHDIIERYSGNELRGVLTHLREVPPLEVEEIFRRFTKVPEGSKLKCLLLPVYSKKNLDGDLLNRIKTTLQEMTEGEVKTVSI